MICAPGRCIKCGKGLYEAAKILPSYSEVVLRLKNNSTLNVAICAGCNLEPEEYAEAIEAINDAFKLNSGFQITEPIEECLFRRSSTDILKILQGGRCIGCHEAIEDKWVVTQGVMMHEGCNLPPPSPVQERANVPVTVRG